MLVAFIGLSEACARISGVVDFPIYKVSAPVGYYPAPSQHGAFLRRNTWAFNDRSMGVENTFRPGPSDVLLVGDSVVFCGNPCRQDQKLGPVLARQAGRVVWPVAAGGWALENEIQMLKANPDLLRVPTLVWVSNTGDFGAENGWPGETTYPVQRPSSALIYLVRKYLLKPHDVVDSPTSPAATARWRVDLADILSRYHGRLIWVLYPKKTEVGSTAPQFRTLLDLLHGRSEIVDIAASPLWRATYYRDGIHPAPSGDEALAHIIAAALHD